jgi:hypothetical protein
MASSYKGLNLFGSGPHRFSMRRRGQVVIGPYSMADPSVGSTYHGPLELEIVVIGRLVAASDAALWTLRDAIHAQLLDPPAPGTLVDHTGKSYPEMSFVRFEAGPMTDRGRVWSIAYVARFIDFKVYP